MVRSILISTDNDHFIFEDYNQGDEHWHNSAKAANAHNPSSLSKSHFAKGMLTENDLTFLEVESFAKGGNGGGKGGGGNNGGGGNGGSEDPNVISEYLSGDEGGYNIQISFKGSWTSDLQQAFIDSAETLSDIILGDLTDVFYRGKVIDDVKIDATLKDIDGEGNILGQAGATAIRNADSLPVTGIMEFDSADANALLSAGQWGDVITHEMIHVLGFSDAIWNIMGDVATGLNSTNPLFVGANALSAYETLYGVTAPAGIPLEYGEGPGTDYAHWDEDTFGNELMTGYLNPGDNNLSDMTVAALEDMGYDTTFIA